MRSVQEAFPIVDILPLIISSDDVVTFGLQDNLIYDVPNFYATVTVSVYGTAFGVNCGQISGASQIPSDDGSFVIYIEEQLQDVIINPSAFACLPSFGYHCNY